MKKTTLTIVLFFITIGIYAQSIHLDSLYNHAKNIVFFDAASNGNIKATETYCYPYFTKHLKTRTLSSTGNGTSDFIFIEIACRFLYDNSCENTIISAVKDCSVKVESAFENKHVLAYNKNSGNFLKLFGFKHNDFGIFVFTLMSISQSKKIANKKYFLKNYTIEGYDLANLIPIKNRKAWWW